VSQLTSTLEQTKQSNADLKEKVEECLRKIRDSKEDQANIEEQLRKELVSKVRGTRRRRREGGQKGKGRRERERRREGRKGLAVVMYVYAVYVVHHIVFNVPMVFSVTMEKCCTVL